MSRCSLSFVSSHLGVANDMSCTIDGCEKTAPQSGTTSGTTTCDEHTCAHQAIRTKARCTMAVHQGPVDLHPKARSQRVVTICKKHFDAQEGKRKRQSEGRPSRSKRVNVDVIETSCR